MIIIASINLSSLSDKKIKSTILAGADILRYNLGYFITKEQIEHIKSAQNIIEELNSDTKIMLDIPANCVRLGNFPLRFFEVKENQPLILKSTDYSADCNEFLPVVAEKIGKMLQPNQIIAIGNGEVMIVVKEIIDENTVEAVSLSSGYIQALRSVNLPIDENEFIKMLKQKMAFVKELEPDYIALPYIDEKINKKVLALPQLANNQIKKVIKMGNQESLKNLKNICQNTNYQMITMDRGKLGIFTPYEKIGLMQKEIIKMANSYHKIIIIATQILESTTENYIPSKADVCDLTNIILDGADGIMLSK